MIRRKSLLVYCIAGAFLSLFSAPVLACTACFGQSDSSMARGMNMGIFALLLVITSVLCAIAGFFVFVARRTAQMENPRLDQPLSQPQTNA